MAMAMFQMIRYHSFLFGFNYICNFIVPDSQFHIMDKGTCDIGHWSAALHYSL